MGRLVCVRVFQLDPQDQAYVTIAGAVKDSPEVVEAKADLSSDAKSGKSKEWTVLARGNEIVNGNFTGKLSLRAGGWYAVSVRARRGDIVIAEQKIEKVGVGDVYITAGQSNSANFGNPRQEAKDDRVIYYNGKDFVPAKDPIPGACGDNGSPWPLLGDLIATSQRGPGMFLLGLVDMD